MSYDNWTNIKIIRSIKLLQTFENSIVPGVILVWQDDQFNPGHVMAWYDRKKVIPCVVGAAYDMPGYLTRPSYPIEGSAEQCDLQLDEFGRFIAFPIRFISNSMPGLSEPVLLHWRKNENGYIRSTVHVRSGNDRFAVYPGDDKVIPQLPKSRKAKRWNKHFPREGENRLCWIKWSITRDGYTVGYAYQADERTSVFVKAAVKAGYGCHLV